MKRMHKLVSILTAAMMLLSTAALPVSAADVLTGDLDGSGEVTLTDAVQLAKAAAGTGEALSAEGRLAADVNSDGEVNSTDLAWLLQYLAGTRTSLGTEEVSYRSAVDLTADIVSGKVASKKPDAAYTAAQLDFAKALMQNEWAQKTDENVLVSPLSVTLALAMTANGAKGDTLAEMEQVLGGGMSIDTLNAYCRGYIDLLPQTEKTSLSVANSVWFDEGRITVPQPFLQSTADYYDASAFRAAFDDPNTVVDVNAWVNNKTHGMIPNIIKEIDKETVMILMNALAFEAEWREQYDKYSVYDRTFTAADGTEQTAQMMYSDEYTYLETPNATGFVKPYYDGYSFAAILPNEGVSLDDYITGFDDAELSALYDGAKSTKVHAGLPKFEYDYGNSLVDSLQAMGMVTPFIDFVADFSGMTEDPEQALVIGDVIHKTHIEVTEAGTRAAAVTAVVMENATAVMDPEQPKEVILDRPFLYAIIDNETRLPVFVGTLTSAE